MKTLCLDIEAADNGEMLELSIIAYEEENQVYHSYFKPARTRSWPNSERVHHISPAKVRSAPSFIKERKKIQCLLDGADAIMGFAVDNDLKYLRDSGILIPEGKAIVEVQQWFWMHAGKGLGYAIDAVPRLSKCAEHLNLDFDEENDAHSATNDTLMTIKLMKRVMLGAGGLLLCKEEMEKFGEAYAREWDLHEEERARGFISLVKTEKGYAIRNNALRPESEPELMIEVAARFTAEHDLRTKFKKRETMPDSGLYQLKDIDIEYFKEYSNSYDKGAEEFYRSYYNPRKARKRKLDFRIG